MHENTIRMDKNLNGSSIPIRTHVHVKLHVFMISQLTTEKHKFVKLKICRIENMSEANYIMHEIRNI